MKHMKKLFGLLLAVVMVFAMSVSVFADDAATYTITLPKNDHTYEIYQIFTGTYATDGSLSNVKWGKNGTGTLGMDVEETTLTNLKNVNSKSETEKLTEIKEYAVLDEKNVFETGKNEKVSVPAGYYLIKDVDGSQAGKNDAYTTYVVQVVGDITVTPKTVKPTVDKQVLDEKADAEKGSTDGWGESADHAINESFKFKLIATLPKDTDYAAYPKYTVKFTDTMSDGVTFEKIDSVTVGGAEIDVSKYVVTENNGQAGGNWSLTIDNVKDISGVALGTNDVKVEVIYFAHLNEKAKVNAESGDTTNKNTVYLEYSNNPNASGEEELGKTPEDSVWVFSYQINNTKYDEKNQPLAGAGFRLYKEDGTTEVELVYDNILDAYRPCKDVETAVEMKSATKSGKFDIKGLDAGKYVLKETTTPTGYNTCEPIEVIIKAEHKENEEGTGAETVLTSESKNMNNKVINRKGSSLPSTGGIGTTIFYVVGGILMAVAAILLITKKKMSNK